MGKTKIKVVGEEPEKKVKKVNKQESVQPESDQTRGKKYREVRILVESAKKYSVNEAVELTQKVSYTKFPGTIEAHLNTISKSLRGFVSLPFSAGKRLTILAFGASAKDSGADIVGTEETIEEILKGPSAGSGLHFDVLVTTPDWMPKLAKVARILGPRGLMPNPKAGTITENLSKAVSELQAGKTEFKTEANGQVIHLGIGKISQPKEEITANIKALVTGIGKSKITKLTLSPTMGPGVKVDLSSI